MLLPSMFASATKKDADKAVVRLFYTSGIPFAIADSTYFKAALAAVAKCGPHYKAPSRIPTEMLAEEVHQVEQSMAPFKEEAVKHGVTLMSDGITNVQNKPIVNFLAATGDGCIFLNTLDNSGEIKDGSFIAGEISRYIVSYGMVSVVQVITDSASNCVAARTMLQQQYPNIVFSPCTTHCLDLLLEDIGKLPWIDRVITDSKDIVKFITNLQYSQACFRNHSHLELLKPGETRFATHFIMLQRLSTVKDALQEKWLNDTVYKEKGEAVTSMILNGTFWSSVETITKVCEPIVELLRLADEEVPCTGKVYWKMFQIDQSVEAADLLPARKKKQIRQFVMDRWKMLHTDLHAAGFVLDPEYSHFLQHQNEEVGSGFHTMIERIYRDDVQSQVKAVQQHAVYRAGQGLFARPMTVAAAKEMAAYRWWMSFGAHVPELQQVAVRVLAQVTSASACERNWSTFDFIHTKKRNRMQCKRVRDVVFVHADLRPEEKLDNINYREETIEWSHQPHGDNDIE